MATDVTIANQALKFIKVSKRITSLDQGVKESNAIEDVFDDVRDTVLEAHTWKFATKRLKLSRASGTPTFEWKYAYSLPGDFVRVIRVTDNSSGRGRVRYSKEGGLILSDAPDIYLQYVRRETDPNLMSPSFRRAFSRYLAASIAMALTNSANVAEAQEDIYYKVDLPRAKSLDSIQDDPEDMPESDWITARHGNSYEVDPAES